MTLKLTASKTNPPIGGLLALNVVEPSQPVAVEWGVSTSLQLPNNSTLETSAGISRYLSRVAPSHRLYGNTVLERTEVDHWLTFSFGPLVCTHEFEGAILYLNKVLGPVTYLVGSKLTIADFNVWGVLYCSQPWNSLMKANRAPENVLRWYEFVNSQEHVERVLSSLPEEGRFKPVAADTAPAGSRKDEGKFVELPGAEIGKVVVRFPPEASGYLHIGHAKAALLNQYYQEAFKGKLIMRFDDTNPAKEKVDFEKVILEDLELLQIKPDQFTHTSNYFDLMLSMCERLLQEGRAYVDDTNPEQMKLEREQRTESRNRNNSVVANLKLWEEMKAGTALGQKCCVRAKIDMSSANGCMRDPTIYRCKNEPHPRTGTKYKVYPTYDFACPIVDSIEGVTHCLRTMEYHDRDDQFYWFIEALGLRKPYIWEYSRLNMTNTVLSKRKLTWFVENGLVDGWDDPRFPTVRGVLRRGMTVEGLKQFIIAQGSSRSVVLMEWDKIWSFNKKVIDPVAPRYTALLAQGTVPVLVSGATEQALSVPKHPKIAAVGNKIICVGPRILIDGEDAETLKEGENATFINWGNLLIKKINRAGGKVVSVEADLNLDNTDFKKTVKLTWLADTDKAPLVPCVCVYFENIISKAVLGKDEDFKQYIGHETRTEVHMLGDPELLKIHKSDIIQLQRRGFFICDNEYKPPSSYTGCEAPVVLFFIPDGRAKEMAIAGIPKNPQEEVASPVTPKAASRKDVEPSVLLTPGFADPPNAWNEHLTKITEQGDKIRVLKSNKAAKSEIDPEVKILLALKAEFKSATGEEWKPGMENKPPTESTVGASGKAEAAALALRISEQGNRVRELKGGGAAKNVVTEEIQQLLTLKAAYKELTGIDFAPTGGKTPNQKQRPAARKQKQETPKAASRKDAEPTVVLAPGSPDSPNVRNELLTKITEQGHKIRILKSNKAAKSEIDPEVKILLTLKAEFKSATGEDWKPGMESTVGASGDAEAAALALKISEQGSRVRELKGSGAAKNVVDEGVQQLLKLKADYKTLTGGNFAPTESRTPSKREPKEKVAPAPKNHTEAKKEDVQGGLKKVTRLGLEAKKEDNLAEWYSQVLTKGELIEYYDVSGCYILRPWSFAIWEVIKDFFDTEIKKLGVQNCYFPLFVSRAVLEKEKDHIADFAPEVAWVTKSGDTDLAEPIAVRPTSETVMYPAYAKWVHSYRDLPIKLNQWNNIVRWEFKHPQPFLRTREFLWQEGHTAYADKKEACDEVVTILGLYAQVYTDLLAIPVIRGRKTEKEKFAGGDYTTTVEAFISASGRAIQGATSHHLGQNFSKMFEIVYDDPETTEKKYVYQNSWGITTRTIGVMIMVHADNQGLVLPPRVACIQMVIIPCGVTTSLKEEERSALLAHCEELEKELKASGLRVRGDYRANYSPGWKFNHWELKGVPVRVEVGPKDMKQQQVVAVRRDTGEKLFLPRLAAAVQLASLLESIHHSLLARATEDLKKHTVILHDWSEFCANLEQKNIILSPFCGETPCEDLIKKDSAKDDAEAEPGAPAMGAKSLCNPFEQPAPIKPSDECIHPACRNKPKQYTLFGRSY